MGKQPEQLAAPAPIDDWLPLVKKHDATLHGKDAIDIEEALDKLRQEQKQLMQLLLFYGMTKEAAAKKLKIPSGTVKTRVKAVVNNLMKSLNI